MDAICILLLNSFKRTVVERKEKTSTFWHTLSYADVDEPITIDKATAKLIPFRPPHVP